MSPLKIMEVNGSNIGEFNRLVKQKGGKTIVKFYADWCGHCQDLNPKWKQMTTQLDRSKLSGLLASIPEQYKNDVDCDKEIVGYPTIRFLVGGKKKRDYNGKREVKDLEKYVKKMLKKCKRKTKKRRIKRKRKKRQTKKKRNSTRDGFRDRFFKMISSK